jgi:transposase
MSIVLGLVLAAIAVLLVALPFLREPVAADDRLAVPDAEEDRRRELLEDRDRALAALKELELDHRAGKIDDADYRELIGPQRREAAAALRALQRRYGNEMAAFETPDLPPEPTPPPDEGSPPTPVPVPEPYPPPDEATIPQE